MNPKSEIKAREDLQKYSNVLRRFAITRSLEPEDAASMWYELVHFLNACADSKIRLTPSKIIDELWHEFILSTQEYATFCTENLGSFVHHVPTDCPDFENYRKTIEILETRAGYALDRRFWPLAEDDASSCSACGSGCSS